MFNIGIYSSSMRMGKSEIAKYLINNHKYNMLTFAKPMKDMITVLLRGLGYSDNDIYSMLYGSRKEIIIPELGVTPRHLLVTLGSEWGRGMINDNMWITLAIRELCADKDYVCEDVRLPNEAEELRNSGFKIIRVNNRRIPRVDSISEGKLDDYDFDYIIDNDGTLEELYQNIDIMLSQFNT